MSSSCHELTIAKLLEGLELTRFLPKFEAEEIDLECCRFLEEDEIKTLIPPLSPRKRFKEAILARQTSSSPVASRAAAVVTPTADDGAPAELCAICMEEAVSLRVDCGHEFCRGCIQDWRRQLVGKASAVMTCPNCRAEVKAVVEIATGGPAAADRRPAWGGAGEASAQPRGPASVTPDAARAAARAAPAAAAESRPRDATDEDLRRDACREAEAQRRAAIQARREADAILERWRRAPSEGAAAEETRRRAEAEDARARRRAEAAEKEARRRDEKRAAAKAAKKERQRERKRTQIAPAASASPTPAPVSRPRRPAAEAAPSRQHRGGGSLWQPGDPPRRALDAASAGSWLESRMRQPALRPAVAVESFESMLRPLAAGAPQAPIPPSPLDWTGF